MVAKVTYEYMYPSLAQATRSATGRLGHAAPIFAIRTAASRGDI